jgi:EAL domain-containing protein (putative c-di-GMP-specific phosphodiesterase class I)/GGDEF domain-containing protein
LDTVDLGDTPAPAGTPARRYEDAIADVVRGRLITPHFQPIVDMHHGTVLAWEVLSRGPEAFPSPAELFAAAEKLGLLPQLEHVCRDVALRTIASFPSAMRARSFFINVSPNVIGDPNLLNGHIQAELAALNLDQRNFVIEITERESIHDYGAFERQIRHYVEHGFRIALDDLGAGHSGLVTLVTCSPHFLKLDMTLARDIHRHSYKQHLVKSLIAFAAGVDATLIAEGVESWEELETLARLGIRFAQGFLFARPGRVPVEPSDETRVELRRIMRQFNYREADLNETVGPLVIRCATLREREKRGEDVDRIFRREAAVDHLTILRDERPIGLITRQHYYTKTGGPVGYHLFQWRPAEELARATPLIVEESINVTALAKLAMERPLDELYDPVIVVDGAGRLIGTVTIRQLIMRSTALEVQMAQGSSPLTGLPGNRSIERWILNAFDQREACVLYADLDRFKEFNDCYGFLQGDEMIRCLARVLSRALAEISPEARLGHIGGDDFVIVSPTAVESLRVAAFCAHFDHAKLELFGPDDAARGSFRATDRRGQEVSVPLVTLSVAVVPVEAVQSADHPGALAQMAASLKRKVKETTAATGRSGFLFERRRLRPSGSYAIEP